ncbi:MAG: CBS domain-containing protein [Flavobacteriaceae bacterium]|nr:CBS domain-containing protein [Flavobacteriaceae bacterium]
MGVQEVRSISSGHHKLKYISHLLDDVEAFDQLLYEEGFENKEMHIGAEQEFCLVDSSWRPVNKAMDLLAAINQPDFTTELALYNLELNTQAHKLQTDCFKKLETEVKEKLALAAEKARLLDVNIILTGILPTIHFNHINLSSMTPLVRYNVLNESMRKIRKQDFEIHIQGLDELHIRHNSIIYEGCNTSFQAHLQITPAHFKSAYNWAQYISGPVLAVATNSPLLLRRQLWHETRIALFSQSVDTRSTSYLLNDKEPRVGFGRDWQRGDAGDYYKDSITRFKSILTGDFKEKSTAQMKAGKPPKLSALLLHNGTDYRWNRLCYGIQQQKPHLRIENRYLPSGPSPKDEIANFCFWVGLMYNQPESLNNLHSKVPFYVAKMNFLNAARLGLESPLFWEGKFQNARKLIGDKLIPQAHDGLLKAGIDSQTASHYLNVIQKRLFKHTGSEWTIKNYRKITEKYSASIATKLLTRSMYENNLTYDCVADWKDISIKKYYQVRNHPTVSAYMKTNVFTAMPDDTLLMVKKIMEWKNIHHLPVVKNQYELVGIISSTDVLQAYKNKINLNKSIRKIFRQPVRSIHRYQTMQTAEKIMQEHHIKCLPVTHENILIGIITSKDIDAWKQ